MTPLPLVNLLNVMVAEVERRKLERVSIFGARVTMETNLFGALQNVEVVRPSPAEIDLIANTYLRIVEDEQASQLTTRICGVWPTRSFSANSWTRFFLPAPVYHLYLTRTIPIFRMWTARVSTLTPSCADLFPMAVEERERTLAHGITNEH